MGSCSVLLGDEDGAVRLVMSQLVLNECHVVIMLHTLADRVFVIVGRQLSVTDKCKVQLVFR